MRQGDASKMSGKVKPPPKGRSTSPSNTLPETKTKPIAPKGKGNRKAVAIEAKSPQNGKRKAAPEEDEKAAPKADESPWKGKRKTAPEADVSPPKGKRKAALEEDKFPPKGKRKASYGEAQNPPKGKRKGASQEAESLVNGSPEDNPKAKASSRSKPNTRTTSSQLQTSPKKLAKTDAAAAMATTSKKRMSDPSYEQELACDVDLIQTSTTPVSESDQRMFMKYAFDLNDEKLSDVLKNVDDPNNNESGDATVGLGDAVGSIEKKLEDIATKEIIVAKTTTTKDSILVETAAPVDNIKSVVGSPNNNESADVIVGLGVAVGSIKKNWRVQALKRA